MKKTQIQRATKKSIFFICPHCKTQIRKVPNLKTNRDGFTKSTECPKCKNRIKLIFKKLDFSKLEDGGNLSKCQFCGAKIYKTSKSCRKCLHKNISPEKKEIKKREEIYKLMEYWFFKKDCIGLKISEFDVDIKPSNLTKILKELRKKGLVTHENKKWEIKWT